MVCLIFNAAVLLFSKSVILYIKSKKRDQGFRQKDGGRSVGFRDS